MVIGVLIWPKELDCAEGLRNFNEKNEERSTCAGLVGDYHRSFVIFFN